MRRESCCHPILFEAEAERRLERTCGGRHGLGVLASESQAVRLGNCPGIHLKCCSSSRERIWVSNPNVCRPPTRMRYSGLIERRRLADRVRRLLQFRRIAVRGALHEIGILKCDVTTPTGLADGVAIYLSHAQRAVSSDKALAPKLRDPRMPKPPTVNCWLLPVGAPSNTRRPFGSRRRRRRRPRTHLP
jgi:hypothetical protein